MNGSRRREASFFGRPCQPLSHCVLSGSLEQLVAVAAVFFVMNFVFSYSALFMLRHREPDAERPFRAWAFPVSTGVVLLGSCVFLVLTAREDPRSALIAAGLLLLSQPAYSWANRPVRT